MLWVLLSICSIFLITSFDHCTRPQHQETTSFHINTTDNSFAFSLLVCNATWNLSINYRVTILTLCWVGLNSLICLAYTHALWSYRKKKNNSLVRAMMCHQPAKLNLIFRHRGYYMAARRSEISLRALSKISQVSAVNEWNILQHEKRNFVSPRSHAMFYLLYRHRWNTKAFHFNNCFPQKAGFTMSP